MALDSVGIPHDRIGALAGFSGTLQRPVTVGRPALISPPVGDVIVQQQDGLRAAVATVGETVPKITAGGGGWQTVERDGRVSLLWWNGRDPAAVAFTMVFDGRRFWQSVEAPCRQLEAMYGIGLADDEPPPAVIFDAAGLIPLDAQDGRARGWRWAITTCEESDDGERNVAGRRVFTSNAVTLQRLVVDDTLIAQSEALKHRVARAQTDEAPKHKKHTVKTGETLVRIASREYGDIDRWIDIAAANNLHDPRAPLKAGTVLKMP